MTSRLLSTSSRIHLHCHSLRTIGLSRRFCAANPNEELENFIRSASAATKRRNIQLTDESRDIVYGTQPCMAAISGQKRRIYRVFVSRAAAGLGGEEIPDALKEILETVKKVQPSALCPVSGHVLESLLEKCKLRSRPDHEGIIVETDRLFARHVHNNFFLKGAGFTSGTGSRPPSVVLACPFAEDMTNFGHVMRVARYYGVDIALVAGAFRQKRHIDAIASAASRGAVDLVDLVAIKGYLSVSFELWKQRFRIVGTVGSGTARAIPLASFKHDHRPVILMIGAESKGINHHLLDLCDDLVTIPTNSQNNSDLLDSLNTAAATSVLLHHFTSPSSCGA